MRGLIILTLILGASSFSNGQAITSSNQRMEIDRKQRVNLYYHLGSVLLPDGFEGAVTINWTDAWGGYIRSTSHGLKIYWAAGMIELPLKDELKNLAYTEIENRDLPTTSLREYKKKMDSVLVAKIGQFPITFVAKIRNYSDRDVFLNLIGSYEKERCPVCRSLKFETKAR